jgi:signal transduction histidine kinase
VLGVPTGCTEQHLRLFCNRYVGAARAVVAALGAVLALPAAPPSDKAATAVLAGILLAWQCVYFPRMRTGRPPIWLLVADFSLVAVVGLAQSWTVPDDYLVKGIGWASVIVSMTVIAAQWHLDGRWAATVSVLLAASYAAGVALALPATPAAGVALAVWMLAEGLLSRGLYVLVRRGARRADDISTRTESTRRQAAVVSALRDDEAEHVAVLHDTVASTLLMVGVGTFPARTPWLSDRARVDLDLIAGTAAAPSTVESVELAEVLAQVCRQAAPSVEERLIGPLPVPGMVATAFCGAVREALGNVAKHAGVAEATVHASGTGSTVTVEITDLGRGFDPTKSRDGTGFGLTGSIAQRMRRVGGAATVTSTPGAGTTVRLVWPVTSAPVPAPAEPVARQRFLRGVRIASLLIAGAVLAGMNLPMLLTHLSVYTVPAVQLAGYGALALVTGLAAVLIVTDRPFGSWRHPLVVLVLAASVVVTADVPAPHLITPAHWSYGTIGWFGTLLLLDRPLRELIWFLGTHLGVSVAQLAVAGQLDGATLLRLGTVSVAIVGFQLAVGACGQALSVLAQQAADDAAATARVITEHETAERLYRRRQTRYAELMPAITPLLAGLADRTLDPGDPVVARRCAVAAAVIRRLLAERGDHDDPLVEELRAVMDVALRKGVVVDLLLGGSRPRMPVPVRRALTEPALTMLAAAESAARVTIDGDDAGVTVSVVADGAPTDLPATTAGVRTTVLSVDDRIWVETQWTVTV